MNMFSVYLQHPNFEFSYFGIFEVSRRYLQLLDLLSVSTSAGVKNNGEMVTDTIKKLFIQAVIVINVNLTKFC
jgi:hypothetical protein